MLSSKLFTLLEFFLLCIVLPTFIWTTNSGSMMFGFLWGAMVYTSLIWLRILYTGYMWAQSCHSEQSEESHNKKILRSAQDDSFYNKLKTEWNWGAMTWGNIRPILIKWVIGTILICLFTWWYEPDRLFIIPREMPQIIPFLIIAYPLLSALPQEFIFCSFFMKRYGHWFKTDRIKILISAIVFGYAHMLFLNWVAPVFSFFGGLLFAYTYLKTRSLALVTFEHSLYGNSIFLAGIGYYFYSGGING
jgi:membrane protease YdiL (CAAX protease family)